MSGLERLRLERRVARVLAAWDGTGPGVSVGVVQEGALVVQRSAGLASLELGVPIGPDTCFRVASVSKQFTCALVLMEVQAGRIDLAAEARRYLPEMPDYGTPVTVAHLLHNVSGLRDMFDLMRHGGADLAQPVSPAQMLACVLRPHGLNFAPGSRYLYSNSGFLLLGHILERVTGEALPDLLEKRIFLPLGMTRTRMTPSTATPVPGLATGYLPQGTGWVRAGHAFPLGGEGGLVSCIEDLALWAENARTGRLGGTWLRAEQERQIAFTGGGEADYACGLMVGRHRGLRTYSHGGLWPGFKAEFLRCPAAGTAVIVLSNNGAADPYHVAREVLDAVVEGRPDVQPVPPMPPRAAQEALVGLWLEAASARTVEISFDAAGRLGGNINGTPFRLVPAEDGRLRADHAVRDFFCRLAADGALEVEFDAGVTARLERVPPGGTLPDGLAGVYACPDTGAEWTLVPAVAGMEARVRGPVLAAAEPFAVAPVAGDAIRILLPSSLFRAWMDVQVCREKGAVTGLMVRGNRARELFYKRVEGSR